MTFGTTSCKILKLRLSFAFAEKKTFLFTFWYDVFDIDFVLDLVKNYWIICSFICSNVRSHYYVHQIPLFM